MDTKKVLRNRNQVLTIFFICRGCLLDYEKKSYLRLLNVDCRHISYDLHYETEEH